MCGIIGFVGYVREGQWSQTHDILRELFLASEKRGQDATGFAAKTEPLDCPFNGKPVWAKEPTTASRFVENNSPFRQIRHQRCSAFIGHVRAATHGTEKNNVNNHPHVGKNGLYLVHNGIITNHREIADKYSLKIESECDSEVLLRLIEKAKGPAEGLDLCLSEVQGSMAVAVLDGQTGFIWMARNSGRPLWLGRLKNDRRWFIASTGQILLDALKQVLGRDAEQRIEYLSPIPEFTPIVVSTGLVLAPLMVTD